MNPPENEETKLTLYGIALDEYRFQVNLNWSRLNYYLGLNTAITTGGAAFLAASQYLIAATSFLVGILAALMAWKVDGVSRGYYRAARDKKANLEKELDLGKYAIQTTPGMAGASGKLKVRHFHTTLLTVIFILNLAGLVLALILEL